MWKQDSYRGWSVFDIEGPKGKPLTPSTRKGGPWLKYVGHDSALTARSNRLLCGHAPIREYRRRFHLAGEVYCRCLHRPIQTRDHLLRVCPNVDRKEYRRAPSVWEEWVSSLKANNALGAFPPAPPIVEEEGWDPR